MKHRILTALAASLALAISAPAAAKDGGVTHQVLTENDGTRTLVHEALLDATVAEVWATLSTAEGWTKWGPKFAEFDLRQGGSIETGYHEGAGPGDPMNIRHRILAFVPERMIALKVEQVPAGGPVSMDTIARVWGVYELEPLADGRTLLRISGLGYGPDEASSQMLEFFKTGNEYSIEMLRRNLAARAD